MIAVENLLPARRDTLLPRRDSLFAPVDGRTTFRTALRGCYGNISLWNPYGKSDTAVSGN
jgi:hypothetical protein